MSWWAAGILWVLILGRVYAIALVSFACAGEAGKREWIAAAAMVPVLYWHVAVASVLWRVVS